MMFVTVRRFGSSGCVMWIEGGAAAGGENKNPPYLFFLEREVYYKV